MHKKVIGIIPARYQSSRFPGKPVAEIAGIPMIVRVYQSAVQSKLLDTLAVATDDERIKKVCSRYSVPCIMTGECLSGSDRVYSAVKNSNEDVIVNIQGDEPLIAPEVIDGVIVPFFQDEHIHVVTAKKKIIFRQEIESPNSVKVVTDNEDFAVYFSRSVIPYNRDNREVDYYKHIGIYAYSRAALKFFTNHPQSHLEKAENLEQLRFIENGWKIKVITTDYDAIGVDIPEDIKKVEKILSQK